MEIESKFKHHLNDQFLNNQQLDDKYNIVSNYFVTFAIIYIQLKQFMHILLIQWCNLFYFLSDVTVIIKRCCLILNNSTCHILTRRLSQVIIKIWNIC